MKHIHDLNELLDIFSRSDFYSVSVQVKRGENHLRFDIDKSGLSLTDCALVIGDALHNLKSALDVLYYQSVMAANGDSGDYTRFPIRDSSKELEAAIKGGLKKQTLADNPYPGLIGDLLLDNIKPYETGNYPLWALHRLNILDKHQLLVPVFDIFRFWDIRLQDDEQVSFLAEADGGKITLFMDESCDNIKLDRPGHLTVKDGRAATTIAFDVGVPYEARAVVQSLIEIAESVTRTIEAFELLPLPGDVV